MHYKSKTLATWIALLGGSLGWHRFYLHGWRDALGWVHAVPTLAGLMGVRRSNYQRLIVTNTRVGY